MKQELPTVLYVCNTGDKFGLLCAFALGFAAIRAILLRKGNITSITPKDCDLRLELGDQEDSELRLISNDYVVHFCGCDPAENEWGNCELVVHETPATVIKLLRETHGTPFSDAFLSKCEFAILRHTFSKAELKLAGMWPKKKKKK